MNIEGFVASDAQKRVAELFWGENCIGEDCATTLLDGFSGSGGSSALENLEAQVMETQEAIQNVLDNSDKILEDMSYSLNVLLSEGGFDYSGFEALPVNSFWSDIAGTLSSCCQTEGHFIDTMVLKEFVKDSLGFGNQINMIKDIQIAWLNLFGVNGQQFISDLASRNIQRAVDEVASWKFSLNDSTGKNHEFLTP